MASLYSLPNPNPIASTDPTPMADPVIGIPDGRRRPILQPRRGSPGGTGPGHGQSRAGWNELNPWAILLLLVSLMAIVAGGVLGCATEPDPLDRTQPEAVNKAMFQGEWYYKLTVTDTDCDNAFSFIGEETATYMGKAFKIRWEITRDFLNGYMVPQRYRAPDGELMENAMGQQSLILAFRIARHYDIRYAYNQTTREDLNVIVENTDRPWNAREYMEVDWSVNLATNVWNPIQQDISTGDLLQEPVASYENVEFFAQGTGAHGEGYPIDTRQWKPGRDPEVVAMNIDTKQSVTTRLRGWWQLYYGFHMDPVTIQFRHSLLKAPPPGSTDYEPLHYPDELFRRFGYFRTEYPVYLPERASLETEKRYLANRWNLAGGRQVVWTASPSFQVQIDQGDAALKGFVLDSIEQWNVVLREATGRADDPMVFQENAPLLDEAGDPVLTRSGMPRWRYETGDLRYNFINIVSKPQSSAPLGYGPSTADSDTGEIINATVNVYGDWVDFVIRRAMDQFDVASGHCTLEDVAAGFYYDPDRDACDSPNFRSGRTNPTGGSLGGEPVAKRTHASGGGASALRPVTMSPALKTALLPGAGVNGDDARRLREELQEVRPYLKELVEFERQNPTELDLQGFGLMAGTRYESMMVPRNNLHSLLPHATSANDPEVVALLSPARRLDPARLGAMKQEQVRVAAVRDEVVMFEPAIPAFVDDMVGRDRDEVYTILRRWIWYTTILHEMGHTLGLRHNFMGSVDQKNFSPEYFAAYDAYWDQVEALREEFGPGMEAGDPDATQAYLDGLAGVPSRHDRYASTSIMDYLGDWHSWSLPVGSWDRAAIAFAYGGKVEVWDDEAGEYRFRSYRDGDFRSRNPHEPMAVAESGRRVRHYLFCSDEKVFDDAFCNRFDRGVTATEIVTNFIQDAQSAYFFQNYQRNRTGFEGMRNRYYIRKWLWTYYTYAKPFAQLSLNSIRHEEFWGSLWAGLDNMVQGPAGRDLRPGTHPDGGEDLLRASILFYYHLLYDVLMRPDYGHFQLSRDPDRNLYWSHTPHRYLDPDQPSAHIEAGDGWGWADWWDVQDDAGTYYERLKRIGVELDKIIALEILSIPAALNTPLAYEKANGVSYWNSLWTANGRQLWEVVGGLVTGSIGHGQNPWCIRCDAACLADSVRNPPQLKTYPVHALEPLAHAGILSGMPLPQGSRCGPDEYPVEPGMDALFPIYPIFYGIAGASHPSYYNFATEYFDNQVKGGNHRFDIPDGVEMVEFVNSSGTKTFQAVQTRDGLGISFALTRMGRDIKNRVELANRCASGEDPEPYLGSPGTFQRDCDQVLECFYRRTPPDWCEVEGWEPLFLYEGFKYRDVDRVEALLIMMQDMIDIAGHYAWRVPGYLQEP